MPTFGMKFFARAMLAMTLSEQFVAPRLNLSSLSPASPSRRRFSLSARVPLVYMC